MLLRNAGKLVLGKTTPFQIAAAGAIGGALGFMPGSQAAGMITLLVLVLVVLNANLFVAAIVGLAAKAASLLLMPVSFGLGRLLLDGPTEAVFRTLINAPVTALLGLEYYAVAGGVVIGAVLGLALAWPIVAGLRFVRRRLGALEEGSDRYQRLMSRWWVKPVMFLLLGVRRGKWTYQDLADRRVGLPIRPLGVVLAVLVVGGAAVALRFASGPLVEAALVRGLERANGATVDVEAVELDAGNGRLVLTGLAIADPNALETDLIRAGTIEADIGGLELLRKRLVLDRIVLSDAHTGATRAVPGRLIGRPPAPTEVEPQVPDTHRLEEYLRTAQEWKERLAQIKQWLERLSGPPDTDRPETLKEYLARRVREMGYAGVRADHLVEGAPTLLIREIVAEKVKSERLGEDETLDIHCRNLSTHPSRQTDPPQVEVRSSRGTIDASALLAGAVDAQRTSEVRFDLRGFPIDDVAAQWRVEPAPMQGGSLDAEASLTWSRGSGGTIDFPLRITLTDTTLSLSGTGSRQIDRFAIPVRITGTFDDPRISVDGDTLARSLADAGAAELAAEARERLDAETENAREQLEDTAGRLLGDLLGTGKEDSGGR